MIVCSNDPVNESMLNTANVSLCQHMDQKLSEMLSVIEKLKYACSSDINDAKRKKPAERNDIQAATNLINSSSQFGLAPSNTLPLRGVNTMIELKPPKKEIKNQKGIFEIHISKFDPETSLDI